MTNKIQIFNNPQFGEVRVVTSKGNEPMFCLADVCNALCIKNAGDVKARLSAKGIDYADTPTNGGVQSMVYINEANLYKCIFQSRVKKAEQFQDWVTDEVLPSIRKTGSYSVQPMTNIQMLAAQAQAMVEMEQKQLLLEYNQKLIAEKVDELELRTRDNGFMSVMGFANIHHLSIGKKAAQAIGRLASKWCKRNGRTPEKTSHERWDTINTYPTAALKECFAEFYPNMNF